MYIYFICSDVIHRIACVSSPTAFKKICEQKSDNLEVFCLEYDQRFKVFGDHFVFYDYNEPLQLPPEFKNSFDVVLADPPFLSEECLCKTAVTIRYLTKDKIILCTGMQFKVWDTVLHLLLTEKYILIFLPVHLIL